MHYIENILNFDFADESKKIEKATAELNNNVEAINTNLSEIKNVWGREEEELDRILKQLEDGTVITEAINAVPMPRDVNADQYVDPTETITGDPAPSSGGGGMTRLKPIHRRALDKIAQYESKSSGGYNAMNQGTLPDKKGQPPKSGPSKNIIGKNLTDMTVGEVIAAQSKRLSNDEGFIHAAGRYQFIGNTLPGVVQAAGIPMNAKFTPEIQDKLMAALILYKRPSIGAYIKDHHDLIGWAMNDLAKEWASIEYRNGRGFYDHVGGNRAHITKAELKAVLTSVKQAWHSD